MSISAVGSASYPQVTLPTAATKPADTDASAPAQSTSAPANPAPAKAASAQESGAGDQDKDAPSQSASTLTKINPDGTVGPMHHHRSPNAPGVVHA